MREDLDAYRERTYDSPTPNGPAKHCWDCLPAFAARARKRGLCTQPNVVFLEFWEESSPELDAIAPPEGELHGVLPT